MCNSLAGNASLLSSRAVRVARSGAADHELRCGFCHRGIACALWLSTLQLCRPGACSTTRSTVRADGIVHGSGKSRTPTGERSSKPQRAIVPQCGQSISLFRLRLLHAVSTQEGRPVQPCMRPPLSCRQARRDCQKPLTMAPSA